MANDVRENSCQNAEKIVALRSGLDWHCPISELKPQARFIRTIDWATTAIGAPDRWPPQLQQMVDLVLADPTPAAVIWGDDMTTIYNEAFIRFAGSKHPHLMGGSLRDGYAEVWDSTFDKIIDRGVEFGESIRQENVPLFLRRHGFLEEVYATYTFVPILGLDKKVAGFHHTIFETTNTILYERRAEVLTAISEYASSTKDLKEFWKNVLIAFESNPNDIPFALAYSLNNTESDPLSIECDTKPSSRSASSASATKEARSCTLAGAIGGSIAQLPLVFDVDDETNPLAWSVKESIVSGKIVHITRDQVSTPAWIFPQGPTQAFGDECKAAILLPIRPTAKSDSEGRNALGFLILGLNPRRPFDPHYERSVYLWSRQLATSAASIVLLEHEIRRQKKLSEQLSLAARQALESEQRLDRFATLSNVGMWIAEADVQATLLYVNKAYQEQYPGTNIGDGFKASSRHIASHSRSFVEAEWAKFLEEKSPRNIEIELNSTVPGRDTLGRPTAIKRWILCAMFPEINEEGETHRVWGCTTDISQQKQAEELQILRLEDLKEAKRQSEKFIDMTSHEIRNPLSAILQCADGINSLLLEAPRVENEDGQTTMLLSTDAIESIEEGAHTIALCAQHQNRIVNDILTLSKLDASLLSVTPTDTDPVGIARHALRLHSQEFSNSRTESELQVEKSYEELEVDLVLLDPSRILQVLINLITNAIKFTQFQAERKVTLSVGASIQCPRSGNEEDDHYFMPKATEISDHLESGWGNGEQIFIHFSVQDTGCGMTEEEMRKLFLRFSQASTKTHITYGGSGLGLFICKEISELHGGGIGVSSNLGKGSTFRFYVKGRRSMTIRNLAVSRSEEMKEITKKAHESDTATAEKIRKLKDPKYIHVLNRSHSESQNPIVGTSGDPDALHVLVVEDNMINQKIMAAQLRKAHCVVHVANHGADALLFLKKTTFAKDCGPNATPLSIVLMDLEMPVMDGLTCVAKIREWQKSGELTRPVPVIAVTANARIEQIEMAKDNGMDDVVTKPFRISELIPQMRNLVEQTSR